MLALILAIAECSECLPAVRATKAGTCAVDEAAISKAINEFLEKDLLGQADIGNQPADAERNKHITVRELLIERHAIFPEGFQDNLARRQQSFERWGKAPGTGRISGSPETPGAVFRFAQTKFRRRPS